MEKINRSRQYAWSIFILSWGMAFCIYVIYNTSITELLLSGSLLFLTIPWLSMYGLRKRKKRDNFFVYMIAMQCFPLLFPFFMCLVRQEGDWTFIGIVVFCIFLPAGVSMLFNLIYSCRHKDFNALLYFVSQIIMLISAVLAIAQGAEAIASV
ncbi:MAG: hypothetical protein LBQ54_06945 [Planctomycetaceae bacterium]|jgi:hypothetical protein|nr:hypothetical protein [Planctomycetaceae bacterium]